MIAIDWGTTSFRAYRLDAAGEVIAQRTAAAGLLSCEGRFETVLAAQIAGWDDPTIVMAGMIGSRSGWREVDYVACPAGIDEVAAGLQHMPAPTFGGRCVWIVPGVAHLPAGAPPEVMRGEETQVLGLPPELLAAGNMGGVHWACLPGTHSKWVQVESGRIVSLCTAMTGEVYALLRQRSLLEALMPLSANDDVDDEAAFMRGLDASGAKGGLLHHLFSVRTQGLFGSLSKAQSPAYLSGLLIGHELRALSVDVLRAAGFGRIHLIGSAGLTLRYARAFMHLGVDTRLHQENLCAHGLYRLAQRRGFAL